MLRSLLFPVACVAGLSACRSAGPYGYAASYAPTSEEEVEVKEAREYDPVMFAREPEKWRRGKSVLFGVVTARTPGPGGSANMTLSIRKLETRNLCSNANDEDTCRVTVSDRDFGILHVLVRLRPEDEVGERVLGQGSLMRVVGTFGDDVDASDGAAVLRATFYRHWPRHYFVTQSKSELMRQ